MSNEVAGQVAGHSVQAGEIHGDVHFHQAPATSVVPRQLPGAVRHFVNRAVEQDALTTLLRGAESGSVVLLSTVDGVAGVGKSTLVVHWAHQVREKFPDGELYVNLRGFDPAAEPMPTTDALRTFLTTLDVPSERIPDDLDGRAALFRSLLHGKQMLVVLDNARSGDQVRPLLPGSSSCLVVVTSRNRLDDLVVREGATRTSLDVLTSSEAHELLAGYLGQARLDDEPGAVNALIDHCAGLPLALGIVAVRAAENPDFPLDELVEELHDAQERLDALDAGGGTGVRAVFSWSYRSLSDGAARMFRLLGLPTGPDISLAAAVDLAGLPQRQARKLLAELTRANLLDQPAPGRYQFHDLLRAYAAECAASDETEEDRKAALHRLFDHYLRTSFGIEQQLVGHSRQFTPDFPPSDLTGLSFDDEDAALAWWDAERANLIAATRQASQVGLHAHAWQIPHTLTYFFRLRGHLDDWIATHEFGLRSARELLASEGEAHLLLSLGTAHFQRKQYEHTAQNQERALHLFEELGDRYWTAVLYTALGEVYPLLQQYDKAAYSLNRALELQRESGDPFGQGAAHAGLGALHAEQEQFEDAFTHLNEALRLYRQVGEDFGEGVVLHNLAGTCRQAGELDEAVNSYRRAVDRRREIGHTQGEAASLHKLGEVLRERGDIDGAKTACQRAADLYEELGQQPEASEVRAALEVLGN